MLNSSKSDRSIRIELPNRGNSITKHKTCSRDAPATTKYRHLFRVTMRANQIIIREGVDRG